MPVIRFIGTQLWQRPGRAGALFAGILAATTGFTVLTGSVATSKLEVTQTVDADFRAAYDILVRPPRARSALEGERNLIRPNHLSSQFGGITLDQWAKVKQVTGVEVAAPIAMLGYTPTLHWTLLDLTEHVDRTKSQQVLRLNPAWISDRGLSTAAQPARYVYITKNPVITTGSVDGSNLYADGTRIDPKCPGPKEVLPSGKRVPICALHLDAIANGAIQVDSSTPVDVYRLLPNGTFLNRNISNNGPERPPGEPRLLAELSWRSIVGTAAIDPTEEARLTGLDRSMVEGRYLTDADKEFDHEGEKTIPVLESTQTFSDEILTVGIDRLAGDAIRAGLTRQQQEQRLTSTAGSTIGTIIYQPGSDTSENPFYFMARFLQAEQPSYETRPDGSLVPATVEANLAAWRALGIGTSGGNNEVPAFAGDTAVRSVPLPSLAGSTPHGVPVGSYDPAKINGFSSVSAVPMETYRAPEAVGADDETRRLLGDQPLWPNSNIGGYLAQPPLLLTSLTAAQKLFRDARSEDAPISAIRVRVADVQHFDELTRERIRSTAEQITLATGLDVDITVGSSPTAQTIVLPAGKFGRPELTLTEGWSRKGVAAAIIQAIDRKSAILFGLVLAVCLLFLGNATTAAVRDRRRELAVLACLGWPRRRLAQVIVGEVSILGLAAGVASALLAWPLSSAIDRRRPRMGLPR